MKKTPGLIPRNTLLRRQRQHLLAGMALVLPLLVAEWIMMSPAQAVDNWEVDGEHGVLHVHGALTESACRLEMASAWQDVDLGDTGTARLQQLGDRGMPITVQLSLQDCLRMPARDRNLDTGNVTWSDSQPAASISFGAPADADNPQLVKVRGAEGLALRLEDSHGNPAYPVHRMVPLLLTPGQDTLTYRVIPERTQAALKPGAYWAQVNFQLHYD